MYTTVFQLPQDAFIRKTSESKERNTNMVVGRVTQHRPVFKHILRTNSEQDLYYNNYHQRRYTNKAIRRWRQDVICETRHSNRVQKDLVTNIQSDLEDFAEKIDEISTMIEDNSYVVKNSAEADQRWHQRTKNFVIKQKSEQLRSYRIAELQATKKAWVSTIKKIDRMDLPTGNNPVQFSVQTLSPSDSSTQNCKPAPIYVEQVCENYQILDIQPSQLTLSAKNKTKPKHSKFSSRNNASMSTAVSSSLQFSLRKKDESSMLASIDTSSDFFNEDSTHEPITSPKLLVVDQKSSSDRDMVVQSAMESLQLPEISPQTSPTKTPRCSPLSQRTFNMRLNTAPDEVQANSSFTEAPLILKQQEIDCCMPRKTNNLVKVVRSSVSQAKRQRNAGKRRVSSFSNRSQQPTYQSYTFTHKNKISDILTRDEARRIQLQSQQVSHQAGCSCALCKMQKFASFTLSEDKAKRMTWSEFIRN